VILGIKAPVFIIAEMRQAIANAIVHGQIPQVVVREKRQRRRANALLMVPTEESILLVKLFHKLWYQETGELCARGFSELRMRC
jgi:hypothetical protein